MRAHLRQLSDAADPRTRTFEARYVLEGDGAAAPLGATVSIRLDSVAGNGATQVPLGAIDDEGKGPGIWIIDPNTSEVHFRLVRVRTLGAEAAVLSDGARLIGEQIVAQAGIFCTRARRVNASPPDRSRAMSGFNLSALAVRERAITLFLISRSRWPGSSPSCSSGRAEDPTFTIKVLTVTAAWPGATAQEMQDLVADPLEKRMQELTGTIGSRPLRARAWPARR